MNNQTESDEIKGTLAFIKRLSSLKEGELGILRQHAGRNLDESLQGFDLFTGLWWPLREKGWAPKRHVSWLVTKLYAQYPFIDKKGATLSKQLGKYKPANYDDRIRFMDKFDQILNSPFNLLESQLCWALGFIRKKYSQGSEIHLDWVQLINDLSRWENDEIKLKWINEFLYINK